MGLDEDCISSWIFSLFGIFGYFRYKLILKVGIKSEKYICNHKNRQTDNKIFKFKDLKRVPKKINKCS